MSVLGDSFPYAARFGVNDRLPEQGRPREEILAELRTIAEEEDAFWRSGKVSGTMYHGGLDHYAFLGEVFAPFAHANVLQRDMCPSATRFEGEIIAMTLDLLHGEAVAARDPDRQACGSVTSGGTESILSSVLAHRDHAVASRGVTRPNLVVPSTAHPAFDKAAHLFGVEVRRVPVEATTVVDPDRVAAQIDDQTVLIVGSAGNYPYGTIDPIADLAAIAAEHGVGCHVDGCLGGFILPFGEQLGYDIPPFDFRVPGVTAISADTHKYGYGFKGTSTILFAHHDLRSSLYFLRADWPGGKYFSPGMAGSRSGGLLAATWAAMVAHGRTGYLERARGIFATSFAMQDVVRSHDELRILGDPTFCFAFTSDAFEIYHVNDHMKQRGWRFNGLQYPDALHFCVTGPSLRDGLVDDFARDLDDAIGYAHEHAGTAPASAAIYGGVPGGHTAEAEAFIREIVVDLLDEMQAVPPVQERA